MASRTDALVGAAFHEIQSCGSHPSIIAGDFNASSETLLIFQAMREAGWVDLGQVSTAYGFPSGSPTCFRSSERPSRIDYAWVNPLLFQRLISFRLLSGVGLPDHLPIFLEFREDLGEWYIYRVPKPPPLLPLVGEAADPSNAAPRALLHQVLHTSCFDSPVGLALSDAFEGEDLDGAWRFFIGAFLHGVLAYADLVGTREGFSYSKFASYGRPRFVLTRPSRPRKGRLDVADPQYSTSSVTRVGHQLRYISFLYRNACLANASLPPSYFTTVRRLLQVYRRSDCQSSSSPGWEFFPGTPFLLPLALHVSGLDWFSRFQLFLASANRMIRAAEDERWKGVQRN